MSGGVNYRKDKLFSNIVIEQQEYRFLTNLIITLISLS